MAKTWAKSLNMWCGRYQSRFLAAGGACFCEGGRIVTLWAALTVLDAVREYRGPGVLPGALCPTLYVMNPLSGTLVAPETPRDEDIPSQGQDTRLVTESVVRDPLLLVRLQKRLDTWTHPWTCIALVLYMVMAAVKS